MFCDLDWPLNASRGLSAIAEFLILYYDVEVHSLDYAKAIVDVSVVPMAVCVNGETVFVPPLSTRMINSFFFFFFYILQ